MKRLIEIDTNGLNAHKYKTNLELFDIITPKIRGLVLDTGEIIEDIDWDYTRKYFNGNGHCIYHKCHNYTSAAEFKYLIIDFSEFEDLSYCDYLSELCSNLTEIYKIKTWNN